MYLKDRIRLFVALGVLTMIALSYLISGDKEIAGYFAIGGLLIYLGTMFYLRRSGD